MVNKGKKVSLILTTYNSERYLPSTLESIAAQDYANLEIIIKDGGSSDRTLEIIEKYCQDSHLDILWESSRDSGIYDAMNQGFEKSSGDIIAFFNDEFVENSAISKLVNAIDSENIGAHSDLVYCSGNKTIRYWKMGNSGRIESGWMPAHPTLFLKRCVYEKYGLYRTDLKCSSDYEFMVRVLKDGENRLGYVPEILVSMFYGGTSSGGLSNYLVSLREGNRALKENHIKNAWLINVKRSIKVMRQFQTARHLKSV